MKLLFEGLTLEFRDELAIEDFAIVGFSPFENLKIETNRASVSDEMKESLYTLNSDLAQKQILWQVKLYNQLQTNSPRLNFSKWDLPKITRLMSTPEISNWILRLYGNHIEEKPPSGESKKQ